MPAARGDQPSLLQLAVGARDGAAGEVQVGGELPDGGQSMSIRQRADRDHRRDLTADLLVRRHRRRGIDVEDHGVLASWLPCRTRQLLGWPSTTQLAIERRMTIVPMKVTGWLSAE